MVNINKYKTLSQRIDSLSKQKGTYIFTIVILLFFFILINLITGGLYKYTGLISPMDIKIDVKVEEDGDLLITEQTTETVRSQNGHFYSIDSPQGLIDDMEILVSVDGQPFTQFEEVANAQKGDQGVYTYTKQDGLHDFRIYQPITQKQDITTQYTYTLEGEVAKYSDIALIDRKFVAGVPQQSNVTLSIHLPKDARGQEDFQHWLHGYATHQVTPEFTNNSDDTITVTYKILNNPAEEFIELQMVLPHEFVPGLEQTYDTKQLTSVLGLEQTISDNFKDELVKEYFPLYGLLVVAIILTIAIFIQYRKQKQRYLEIAGGIPNVIFTRPSNKHILAVKKRFGQTQNGGMYQIGIYDFNSILLSLMSKGYVKVIKDKVVKEREGLMVTEIIEEEGLIFLKTRKEMDPNNPLTTYEQTIYNKVLRNRGSDLDDIQQRLELGFSDFGYSRILTEIDNHLYFKEPKVVSVYSFQHVLGFILHLTTLAMFYFSTHTLDIVQPLILIGITIVLDLIAMIITKHTSKYPIYEKEEDIRESAKWAAYLNMFEEIAQIDRRVLEEQMLWDQIFSDAAAFGILDKVQQQLKIDLPDSAPLTNVELEGVSTVTNDLTKNYQKTYRKYAVKRSSTGGGSSSSSSSSRGRRSSSGGSGGRSSRGRF